MSIKNIGDGDPLSKVTLRINWRLRQYWPPQEEVEVGRYALNLVSR